MDMQNMRKLFNVLLLVLIAFTCASCHKELDVKDPVVSNDEMTVSGAQARFSWCVEFSGAFQTGVELSPNENMTELRRVEAKKEGDKYVAVVDGLLMGTKYYYRIVVWNKLNNYVQEMKSFSTSTAYTVTLSCNPEAGGSAMGGGTYVVGDTCTVAATANVGYNFVNWTENGKQVSTEAEYKFTVINDRNLVAHFTSQEYTITATAEPEEGGIVNGSGGYNNGDECTLTATANEGYTFINWTKDGMVVSTDSVYTFTVTETAIYEAHFQLQSYTITVSADQEEGGFVEGGGTYEYGQNCTVRATEANGYHFVNWTENGEQVSSEEEYTFTVIGNRDLVANFTSQQYTITVSASPTDGGSVTGGGTYYEGEQCTVTALPADGYTFTTWYEMYYDPTGGGGVPVSNDASYTFTVNRDLTLRANFTSQPQAPQGAINGLFTINDNGDQVYFSQGNLQYQASTNTWRFAENQWDFVGTQNPNYGDPGGTIPGSDNANISENYCGWIDLFGWGTSGYHDPSDPYNVNYQPWSISTSDVSYIYNYYGYGPSTNMADLNLTGTSANYDWGIYNPISNGGNIIGQWRTLTGWHNNGEWTYVFYTRNTTSGIRYAKAQITGTSNGIVDGVILFPDDWSTSTYNPNGYNQDWVEFSSNSIPASQWPFLEEAGAVFLPAAGYRVGISVNHVGSEGNYLSTTSSGSTAVYFVSFDRSILIPAEDINERYFGRSVRLVCPAERTGNGRSTRSDYKSERTTR